MIANQKQGSEVTSYLLHSSVAGAQFCCAYYRSEWTSSHQCTSWGWGHSSRFGDEPKTHPLPIPRDFSTPFSVPKFTSPTYLHPSYLPHLISCSLHFQSLSSTERHTTRLEEGAELNARGMLHPKCKSEKRKVNSLPSLELFFYVFFSALEEEDAIVFFFHIFVSYLPSPPLLPPSYLTPRLVFLCATIATNSLSYIFMCYCCSEEDNSNKLLSPSFLCLRRKKRLWQLPTLFLMALLQKKVMTTIVAFFNGFAKKRWQQQCHHLLLWWWWCWCCEKGDGNKLPPSFFLLFFFLFGPFGLVH